MGTKKIKMQRKTVDGYDLVHPETELAQIEDLQKLIVNQETDAQLLAGNDLLLVNRAAEAGGKIIKKTFADMAGSVLAFNKGFSGEVELVSQLPAWDGFTPEERLRMQNMIWYVWETESFWYAQPHEDFFIWANTDHAGSGVNIVVSSVEPQGLNVGDFWYQTEAEG
jgi:hypothetical protein